MYYLSFPGLGIEPFHIDKVAFSVLGRDVAWYGLLITCGMVLAVPVAAFIGTQLSRFTASRVGPKPEEVKTPLFKKKAKKS